MANEITKDFSTEYKETLFLAWYRAGKPKRYAELIIPDERNITPSAKLVGQWKVKDGWENRAATLDLAVAQEIQKKAIIEKVEMLERHSRYGKALQEKGFKFFQDADTIKEGTALQLIKIGSELEKNSRGLSQALLKISKMDNSDLAEQANKMLDEYDEQDVQELLAEFTEGEFTDIG